MKNSLDYIILFFIIYPPWGETNSHEYLVKTSGEYINFEEVNEEIEALRAEITQLRQDLLNLQIENIQLAANQSDDPATDLALQRAAKKLNVSTSELIKTSTDLSSNTITSTNGE